MFFEEQAKKFQRYLGSNYTVTGLKFLIVVVCIAIIGAALLINNPIVLGAILAYILLP